MNAKSINRGKQLKFAREYRGYTQSELCRKVKSISQPNLSRYEKGFEGVLEKGKVEKIMSFLNFPLSFLEVRLPECYNSNNL